MLEVQVMARLVVSLNIKRVLRGWCKKVLN
uniref:Uncharacterized protein n=1 Tax=Anguilla anguilla TaxID=7936 RepID=A0A0E9R8L0_ANGAN